MLQWVSVIVAGLIGGATITFIKGGTGPLPPFLKDPVAKWEKKHPWQALLIFYLPLNALLGMVASFLVWALGTAGDLGAHDLSASQWATFIITGFGGSLVINTLYERAKKADFYDEVATTLADTLDKLQKKVEELKKKR